MTPKSLPDDYAERVYAGVLGKIIGVYLGRPFEGWLHRDILSKLGEVDYYVHDRFHVPLVVTDDDISGTFSFLRALPDYDFSSELTAEQIGQTWMNYIIENRSILWWGGMGMSTEHTAFLRMKHGIKAPASGSIATNGQVVAEQIGAQIFIDGWGLIHPGDPAKASDFARRAGSVSHDGEAIYGAQVIAALIAEAFVESDINKLLDVAVAVIPSDSVIAQLIADIRGWHTEGLDWQQAFYKIEEHYGYDKFGGNCHIVPNHALIIHALLYGEGDFHRSLMIVNTCGWDTDCNSGNVGCILGVRNGLAGFDKGPDWRGPVADRMYLPTSDGGRCITDAATETIHVVNAGRALRKFAPVAPKNGARFHFDLPGSVQGFRPSDPQNARLSNESSAKRALKIQLTAPAARIATETFASPEGRKMPGYSLAASPTIYSGQTIHCTVSSDPTNAGPISITPYIGCYGPQDDIQAILGRPIPFAPGEMKSLDLPVPATAGFPIAEVGIDVSRDGDTEAVVYLESLSWDGTPNVVFSKAEGSTWRDQWVNGISELATWGEPFRLIQNEGTGLLITGCRDWTDYRVESSITLHLVASGGIAARVQGMKRYYALVLVREGGIHLVKSLDGETILAESSVDWELGETHHLALEVSGNHIKGFLDHHLIMEFEDADRPLTGGGIALILTEGRMSTQEVKVGPL